MNKHDQDGHTLWQEASDAGLITDQPAGLERFAVFEETGLAAGWPAGGEFTARRNRTTSGESLAITFNAGNDGLLAWQMAVDSGQMLDEPTGHRGFHSREHRGTEQDATAFFASTVPTVK